MPKKIQPMPVILPGDLVRDRVCADWEKRWRRTWERSNGPMEGTPREVLYVIHAVLSPETWSDGFTDESRALAAWLTVVDKIRPKPGSVRVFLKDGDSLSYLDCDSRRVSREISIRRKKRPGLEQVKKPYSIRPYSDWNTPIALRFLGGYFARAPKECLSLMSWIFGYAERLSAEKTTAAQLAVQTENFVAHVEGRRWTAKDVEARLPSGDNSAVVEVAIGRERKRVSEWSRRRNRNS